MIAVATIVIVAVISLLLTRVATLAFVLTGMSQEAARFQARSALTGTGFTTHESEGVVNHPVRRRIVMALMLVGGAGVVTTVATLVIGFANASRGEAFARLLAMLAALAALLVVSRTRWFDRAVTPLLARLLDRWTDLDAKDYAGLLHVGDDWSVGQIAVRLGDWLACERLADVDLRAEGVAVLGIERRDGAYVGAPRLETAVRAGDVLLLYGRRQRLRDLDHRRAGAEGDRAHAAAVGEQQRGDHAGAHREGRHARAPVPS